MSFIKKNGIIALLVIAVIYVYAPPSRNDAVRLPWLDEIKFIITSLAPAKPDASVPPVDPAATAQAVEDLDYRMAQRIGSLEGWRSFLSVHKKGLHAQSARAEVEKLLGAERPPAPVAAAVPNGEPPMAKAVDEVARPQPSQSEAASLAADEICRRDVARLERLSSSPTIDEAMRFGNELRCERLRPELFRLTERLDTDAPGVAAAVPNGDPPMAKAVDEAARTQPSQSEAATLAADENCWLDVARLERLSSNPTSDEARRFGNELRCERLRPELFRLTERLDTEAPSVAVAPPSPPSRVGSAQLAGRRATETKTRWTVSSRSLKPRRRANRCLARSACSLPPPSLPPILVALFGDPPRSSIFLRMKIPGGASGAGTSGASSSVGAAASTSAAAGGGAGGGNAGDGDGDGNGNGGGHGGGGGESGGSGHGGNGGGGNGGGH